MNAYPYEETTRKAIAILKSMTKEEFIAFLEGADIELKDLTAESGTGSHPSDFTQNTGNE